MSGDGDGAVVVRDLVRRYGDLVALDGLSLSIPKGSIYGLVGPNGAGKSTLIKTLVGALVPHGGSVRVLGLDPRKDRWRLRRRVGYMPQEPALYADLTVRQNVRFFAAAHLVDGLRTAVEDALRFVELSDRADDRVHTLSGGMRQRTSLAAALAHPIDLAILDEPTAGVDPELRRAFWDRFRELRDGGATVIVSTHQMSEVMECDLVAIIDHGRLVVEEPPRELVARGASRVRITRRDGTTTEVDVEDYRTDLPRLLGLEDVVRVELVQEPLEDVVLRLVRGGTIHGGVIQGGASGREGAR